MWGRVRGRGGVVPRVYAVIIATYASSLTRQNRLDCGKGTFPGMPEKYDQ